MKRFLAILTGLLLLVCIGQLGQADWKYNPFTGALDYYEAAGTGDMTKAIYDSDNDGNVDSAAGGTDIDVSGVTGYMYVNTGAWAQDTVITQSVNGVDFNKNSDVANFILDGSDFHIKWSDGNLNLQTDEGTNTDGVVQVLGKGSGVGKFWAWDTDDDSYIGFEWQGDDTPNLMASVDLNIQYGADSSAKFFAGAGSAENPSIDVYGYVTAGAAARMGFLQVEDVNDEFLVGVENNANIEGVTINLPEANQAFRVRGNGGLALTISNSGGITGPAGSALTLNNALTQDINLWAGVGSGNQSLTLHGWNTAGGDLEYTELTMDDVNDEFLIQAANSANHEGVTANLPEASQAFRVRGTGGLVFSVAGSDGTVDVNLVDNALGYCYDAETTATPSGSFTVDWTAKHIQRVTITGVNLDITFTNPPGPCRLWLVVVQGDGDDTIDWTNEADIIFPGGTDPVLSTGNGDVDVVTFIWDGTNYLGVANYDFS